MCIARALYDNIAESPDELAFRRGDQLTVLEQNTNGLEGWWLCSLRGRQGICPGNRLRILAGVYETPPTTPVIHQQTEFCGERRSWHVQPNRVSSKILSSLVLCHKVATSNFYVVQLYKLYKWCHLNRW